jgi:hypothetical protein
MESSYRGAGEDADAKNKGSRLRPSTIAKMRQAIGRREISSLGHIVTGRASDCNSAAGFQELEKFRPPEGINRVGSASRYGENVYRIGLG